MVASLRVHGVRCAQVEYLSFAYEFGEDVERIKQAYAGVDYLFIEHLAFNFEGAQPGERVISISVMPGFFPSKPAAQETQAQAATECIAPASTHTDPERRVSCQPNPDPDLERRAPLAAALAGQKGV